MAPPPDGPEQPQNILGAGAAPVPEAGLVPQRQQQKHQQRYQSQGQGCRWEGPEVGLKLKRQGKGAGPADGRRWRDLLGRIVRGQAEGAAGGQERLVAYLDHGRSQAFLP
jgi:hypothetical protein